MGYGFGHTELVWSASKIKGDYQGFERERCSLVGDAFSIYSFVIVGAGLCLGWIPQIHYRHLCQRMGMAPGFRAALRLQAPLARKLQYGCQGVAEVDGQLQVKDFNRLLLGPSIGPCKMVCVGEGIPWVLAATAAHQSARA